MPITTTGQLIMARQYIKFLEEALDKCVAVLEMYADPQSYFGVAVWPDPPCGAFGDDFSEHDDPYIDIPREVPGKAAREILDELLKGGLTEEEKAASLQA